MQIDLHRIAAVAQQEKPETVKDSGIKGKKKEELHELVKKQQLRVKGTGKNDSVLKKDLIRVLQRGSDESGETLDERESRQKAAEEEEATSKQKVLDDRARRRHDKLAKKRSKPAFYQSLQLGGQPTEFDEETRQKVKGRIPKATNGAVVDAFARSAGIPKKAAKKFAGAYWRNIFQTLAEQGSVELPGVGRLEKKWYGPRRIRNPQTMRMMKIPGRWKVRLDPNKLTRSMPSSSDVQRMIDRSGLDLDFEKASGLVDTLQAVIEKGLRTHGQLPAGSFGKLQLVTRKARGGFNPHTGEGMEIPKSKKLKFKPSKAKFKTFFDEAEADKKERDQAAKQGLHKEYLEGGIMRSLEDVFMDPSPNPGQFIRDVQRGEFGDEFSGLTTDQLRGSLKKFWPEAKKKWGKPAPESIVGPEDLGEQGLEKAPREPLEDIVEKSREEDPGISGPELEQPGEGAMLSGDPEIDEIFKDAFGDQAAEIFKEVSLPPKPEVVPTSGEVQALDPDAKLPDPGEPITSGDPEDVKQKLKDKAKKKGWLRSAWNGMTAAAKWGVTKAWSGFMRATGAANLIARPYLEGAPGAPRWADFVHGLALTSAAMSMAVATRMMGGAAGLAATGGTAGMVMGAIGLFAAAYYGGSMMAGAAFNTKAQRDLDLIDREINRRQDLLEAQGKDWKTDPALDQLYEKKTKLKDSLEAEKLGARAQAKAQKIQKQRKKLEEAKRRAEEKLAKLDQQGVVSVDIHRIMSVAATNPVTEVTVDLDQTKRILEILSTAREGTADRVLDIMSEKIAAVNRGEASAEDFDPVAVLQEAAA